MKGAHRKLLDVANTLGLSNTLIKMVERRETVFTLTFQKYIRASK
jgi:hypothetical protein